MPTVVATETFTGTTGAAWPSQWKALSASGTATIQSNRGRLLATGVGYQSVRRTLTSLSKRNVELYVEFIPAALTESYIDFSVRQDTTKTGYFPDGYFVSCDLGGNVWTLGAIDSVNGQFNNVDTAVTFDTSVWAMRLNATDSTTGSTQATVSAKVWKVSAGEPASWVKQITDVNYPRAGSIAIGYQSGNTTNPGCAFDNVSVTDLASGTVYTATSAPSAVVSLSAGAASARAAAATASAATTVAAASTSAGASPAPASVTASVAASTTVQRAATAAVTTTATPTAVPTRSSSDVATVAVTATPSATPSRGTTGAATITTVATPAASSAVATTASAAVSVIATPAGTPSRGSTDSATVTATTSTAGAASRAGAASASIAATATPAAGSSRSAVETAAVDVAGTIAGSPSRGMSAAATIGLGVGTSAPNRADGTTGAPVTADTDLDAGALVLAVDDAAIHITPALGAGGISLGAHDEVQLTATIEPSAGTAHAGRAAAEVTSGISVLAALGDIPPGAADLVVNVGITAVTRAGQTASVTVPVGVALTAAPSQAPAGSVTVTLDTLLAAATTAARNTPAGTSTAASVDAVTRATRLASAALAVTIGIAAKAETDDPNPIIRITARIVRRALTGTVDERTLTGRIPARTRKGSIVNRYPYGTREFVAVEVTDGGTPITSAVEFAVVKGSPAESAWSTAEQRSGALGFTLDEDVLPGTWSVFARYTRGADRPVVDCGSITVSGRAVA